MSTSLLREAETAEWPDWTGRAVAIVASGPSTKKVDVELLKGRLPVLAIKKNVELAPWADVVYGCDAHWWKAVRGLPDFHGLKLSYDPAVCDQYGLRRVEIPGHATSDHLLFDKTGSVGGGGNSGFQALNLAVQFGASRILLIGFDCQDRSGSHWFGRNNAPGQSNPSQTNFRRWIRAFNNAAEALKSRGVDIVNASPISELTCFRRQSVADTLQQWGLA